MRIDYRANIDVYFTSANQREAKKKMREISRGLNGSNWDALNESQEANPVMLVDIGKGAVIWEAPLQE